MEAIENAPTSEGSYYTVNRVCHLETRVLQARSHGQACSREHMHIQLKWYITPNALHAPQHKAIPSQEGWAVVASSFQGPEIRIGFML